MALSSRVYGGAAGVGSQVVGLARGQESANAGWGWLLCLLGCKPKECQPCSCTPFEKLGCGPDQVCSCERSGKKCTRSISCDDPVVDRPR